jgi:Lon protease-like protein
LPPESFEFRAERFSGRVPLFPLPSVVLVPVGLQAFHIFEPRYRELLHDALDGEGLIAVPLLLPGWEPGYYGAPPIHPVCGLGCIKSHQVHEDGKGDILLAGVARVRVRSEDRSHSYRVGEVDVLEDQYPQGDPLEAEKQALLKRFSLEDRDFIQGLPAGEAADVILGQMALPAELKQRVFEQQAVRARISAIHQIMDQMDQIESERRSKARPPGPPGLN